MLAVVIAAQLVAQEPVTTGAERVTAVVDLGGARALVSALRAAAPAGAAFESDALVDAALADVSSAGVRCAVSDVPCLQKIAVLAGFDAVLAVTAIDDRVLATLVTRSNVVARANVPAGDAPSATAGALWAALRSPPPTAPSADPHPEPPASRPAAPRAPPAAGDATWWVVGAASLGGAAVTGLAAGVLSADLARQLEDARDHRAPLGPAYDALELGFVGLLGVSAVAGTGGLAALIVAAASDEP